MRKIIPDHIVEKEKQKKRKIQEAFRRTSVQNHYDEGLRSHQNCHIIFVDSR